MPVATMSPLEMPLPPETLKATDGELQALREIVQRIGWHEASYRVCELLAEEYERLPDCTKKGAIKMVANGLAMIVPSCHWIDKPLVLRWSEKRGPNHDNHD
jgi:hypothetical protein